MAAMHSVERLRRAEAREEIAEDITNEQELLSAALRFIHS